MASSFLPNIRYCLRRPSSCSYCFQSQSFTLIQHAGCSRTPAPDREGVCQSGPKAGITCGRIQEERRPGYASRIIAAPAECHTRPYTHLRCLFAGFAGACAGLLLPFTASAAQTTLKDDMPVTRTDRPDNNVYMPGLKYQKFDKPTAGGLVYVGRGTGSKGT